MFQRFGLFLSICCVFVLDNSSRIFWIFSSNTLMVFVNKSHTKRYNIQVQVPANPRPTKSVAGCICHDPTQNALRHVPLALLKHNCSNRTFPKKRQKGIKSIDIIYTSRRKANFLPRTTFARLMLEVVAHHTSKSHTWWCIDEDASSSSIRFYSGRPLH